MASIPAILYQNVELTNALESGPQVAYREVVRSGAILDTPSDYYVGVARAAVPCGLVPLAVGVMDPASANGLDLVDKLTLSYNATTVEVPIRLLKQVEEVVTGLGGTQPDGYSFIQDRVVLAAMLTDALARATTALNALVPGLLAAAPYVSFDAETQLNILTATPLSLFDLTGTETAGRANKVLIWFNRPGALQWQGFATAVPRIPFAATPPQGPNMYGYLNLRNDGRDYLGAPNPSGSVLPTAPATTPLIVRAGYPNTAIVALQTIQIRTSLPSMPELTDTPPGVNSSLAASVSILTDLRPDSTQAPNTYQMDSVYVESGLGQIRWIKLTGSAALTNFSISLWWVDHSGKARQLYVLNESISVKLCFARRSIIDNWAFSSSEIHETRLNALNAQVAMRGF